jgi:hypothetical protein
MREAGLGDVGSIEMVKRLGLRCRWLERIVRDVGGGCRACSDRRYGKLIAWLCVGGLVRMDVRMSGRGRIIEDGGNKSRRVSRMWYAICMRQGMDNSAIFGE